MPSLAAALAVATETAPAEKLFAGQGFAAIAGDPYFQTVLASTVVRDVALERLLTGLRAAILRAALAGEPRGDNALAFASALAQQCFINEYVFAVAPEELDQVARLKAMLSEALSRGTPIHPMALVAFGMYGALHTLPGAQALVERPWPPPAAAVVSQQVSEPLEEQALRATMPRLTAIGDGVSAQVRQQYEENPYPRWVRLPPPPDVLMVLDDHIRHQFPSAPFRPTGKRDTIDVLVAGSGTGRNALEFAQSFRGANVLAIDISLASLANAKRHLLPALAGAVEFAQGDILNIASIDRSFDAIIAGGVLHHMEEPFAAWRELIKLMRPNALMQVGLYSAIARRDIIAARAMIAARGYSSTPEGIRRCREDLRNGTEKFNFLSAPDFFTISECRDLLFHVHEHQMTIPEIKTFLEQNDLTFIGFEFFPQPVHMHYRNVFTSAGWSLGDLDRWDAYEREHPDTFVGMYIFWIQKK
jgi:SAM-dependent methyltransferase